MLSSSPTPPLLVDDFDTHVMTFRTSQLLELFSSLFLLTTLPPPPTSMSIIYTRHYQSSQPFCNCNSMYPLSDPCPLSFQIILSCGLTPIKSCLHLLNVSRPDVPSTCLPSSVIKYHLSRIPLIFLFLSHSSHTIGKGRTVVKFNSVYLMHILIIEHRKTHRLSDLCHFQYIDMNFKQLLMVSRSLMPSRFFPSNLHHLLPDSYSQLTFLMRTSLREVMQP